MRTTTRDTVAKGQGDLAPLLLVMCAQVFKEYFKELEEESIRDNFVITYELLDEMMDFGYPQTTDQKILQEYIFQNAHKMKLDEQARPLPELALNSPSAISLLEYTYLP